MTAMTLKKDINKMTKDTQLCVFGKNTVGYGRQTIGFQQVIKDCTYPTTNLR